ncbi:hypothetical protein NP493_7038g00001 [Ridgeia piscesae]|uniref:Uncharacterized protein n=1 Tax=Ridgeia piscesae TaxID=27915 RepID=A0AAD9MLQ7_RIDPI|nr:hypothetical protein NP493_7038g00001 [Ridgeia piscesae]
MLMEITLQSNSIGDFGACKVTEAIWDLPRLIACRLRNNYLSESGVNLVRRTVYWNTTQGQERVQLLDLDVQRLPGEELYHPDRIVTLERQVAVYERALEQLLRRPVGQREWYWGQQVTRMEDYLVNNQGWLSLWQAERDGRTDLVTVDRVRQLQCQLDALYQTRHYD